MKLPRMSMSTLLRCSAILTIAGLALMVWSLLQPTPLPVILAMSIGQAIGISAFGMYLIAIVIDLRRGRQKQREAAARSTEAA